MRLLAVSFFLAVRSLAQTPAAGAKTNVQTAIGNCSPNIVSSGSGPVTVDLNGSCNGVDPRILRELTQSLQKFLAQFPKTIGHLNELLDKKDVELTAKAREIDDWIKKCNELSTQLQEQPAGDTRIKKATDALNRGDLGDAETLLKEVTELRSNVASRELASKAEDMVVQGNLTAARDTAIKAWKSKHTEAALKAVVDAYSLPKITLAEKSHYTDTVNTTVFSPNGQRVLTAGIGAWEWDATTGKLLVRDQRCSDAERVQGVHWCDEGGSTGTVKAAAFSPDGKRVVTAEEADSTVQVWDAASGKILMRLDRRPYFHAVNTVAFSPDGNRVVTAEDDSGADRGTARVWDATTGTQVALLDGHADSAFLVGLRAGSHAAQSTAAARYLDASWTSVKTAAFSRDSKLVVTASEDHTARVWDAVTGRQLAKLEGHADHVLTAAFSPDGKRVVTTSEDRTARVWDAATGKELAKLETHLPSGRTSATPNRIAKVNSAAFSPDGQRVVTANDDTMGEYETDPHAPLTSKVRVWDAASGELILLFDGHTGAVNTAVFSSDGRRVLTAGSDHTARVWDAVTGKELALLRGNRDAVKSAAFSPDGQHVVTIGEDDTVAIYKIVSSDDVERLFSKP